ncbi:MAG: hypothetical protein ACQEWV_28420 [Bacillota bacterium]
MSEAKKIENKVKKSHSNELLNQYKETITTTVINTFGLGPYFHQDMKGGSVSTLHNADKENHKDAVFASEKDRINYQQDFDRNNYLGNWSKKVEAKKLPYDEYTGKSLEQGDLDHVISAKSLYDNKKARLYLSSGKIEELATSDENLAYTSSSVNRSKQDKDLLVWQESTASNGVGTNAEKYNIDTRSTKKIHKRATKHINAAIRKEEFKRITTTSVNDGFRMGTRKAIGLLLYEFTSSVMEEFKKYFKNFKDFIRKKSVISEFKKTLVRVVKRVTSRTKDIGKLFVEGFVSGFLSNIITVLINNFITTQRRIVRIIREGFYSIVKAVKLLLFPPENMNRQQLLREVIKLLTLGIVVAGGILLEMGIEEAISAQFPPLREYANMIASVISGILVGIVCVTAMYLIDRWEHFLQESTGALLQYGQDLALESNLQEESWYQIKSGIHTHDSADEYFKKLNKTDRNIDDVIDFFDGE